MHRPNLRRIITGAAIAVCLPLSLSAATAYGATAAPQTGPGVGAPFNLYNANTSDRCIGIAAGQPYAGDWTCAYSADQGWEWGAYTGTPGSHGYRVLVNGDDKCLGVAGGSTANGARVTAWTCNGAANEYWAILGAPTSYVSNWYVNYGSGLVIGVAGGSTANGAEIVQWHQKDAANQYWIQLGSPFGCC